MNLPNKLTILRMIMIPFFVVFLMLPIGGGERSPLDRPGDFCGGQPDRYSGRLYCQKRPSGDRFREIYGSPGRQASGLLRHDLSGGDRRTSFLDCNTYHCQRVYYQRFPADCRGQRDRHCRQQMGKIENHLPDGHGHSAAGGISPENRFMCWSRR